MKKRALLSVFTAASMMITGMCASVPSSAASKEGKVLNIYSWNEAFKDIFETYAADITKEAGVTVNWVINPSDNNNYLDKLSDALVYSDKQSVNNRIDLFLVEPHYSSIYTDSQYVLPVSSLGVTEADMKYQYDFTKDLMRSDGKVMGVTWNACSGVFLYRRSIAKKVLGTDDPKKVQKYVKDWKIFDSTAAKMSKKGYYMTACSTDMYRLFKQSADTPWVKYGDTKMYIADSLNDWVSRMYKYNKNSYSYMAEMWSDEYAEQCTSDGITFGFFWPQWGVDYIVPEYTDKGSYGDFAVCEGPAAYYWGGSYMCAAKCTDNKGVIGKIMKRLTCDPNVMYKLGKADGLCVNNTIAMKKLANTKSLSSSFLKGQNPFEMYHNSALKASGKNLTLFDYYLDECFTESMVKYIEGTYTKKKALNQFYKKAIEGYPMLKK